jgi:hypothetical protein
MTTESRHSPVSDRLDLAQAARDSRNWMRSLRWDDESPTDDAVKLFVDLLGYGGRVDCAQQVAAEACRLGCDASAELDELASLLDEASAVTKRLAGNQPATV